MSVVSVISDTSHLNADIPVSFEPRLWHLQCIYMTQVTVRTVSEENGVANRTKVMLVLFQYKDTKTVTVRTSRENCIAKEPS
jgi:hypothetical protein